MQYIWALDLSLSRTGITIFEVDDDMKFVSDMWVDSVETKPKDSDGQRLKILADYLLGLKKEYNPKVLVIERGFYRFNKSTQKVYAVHGVVAYLFYDVETVYYPPATVKKAVTGNGNAKKDYLREYIIEHYNTQGTIMFANNDESDSFAVGLCYMKQKGIVIDGEENLS